MNIKFEFKIGQKVTIIQNDVSGFVRDLWCDRHLNRYFNVEYIDSNGAIFAKYFDASDLKISNKK